MQVRTRQHDTVDALVWRYLGDGAGYVEHTLETVSYTHLTLPTNREV